jgi:hypothetical protein
MLPKPKLFPSSGERREIPALLDPLERVDLNLVIEVIILLIFDLPAQLQVLLKIIDPLHTHTHTHTHTEMGVAIYLLALSLTL